MKKLLLLSSLILLVSCSNNSNNQSGPTYTNIAPNNIQINMVVGFEDEIGVIEVVDNDVYLKYEKENEWSFSYFADLKNGSYSYYQKNTNNGMNWESYVPVTTSKDNPNSLDAILTLVGATHSMFYDIFDVKVVNGTKPSGTALINGKETIVYNVDEKTYWINEEANICMKIATDDSVSLDWKCEVKSFASIDKFIDSPSL